MGTLLAIVQLVAVPILLAVALALRFGGRQVRALDQVDYARVADPAALHRWAGNRMLLLPVVFLATGLLSFQRPDWSLPLLLLATLITVVIGMLVSLGSERFQQRR